LNQRHRCAILSTPLASVSEIAGPLCLGAFFVYLWLRMAHIALFADAGYVLAGAHDLLGGSTSRSAFACDYEALLPALREEIERHSGGLTFLRTYWYDGARDGIATVDHRRIENLPYVKVRLGRLNRRGQQKGVDGLIYRDLTALARARAIERAYLFTGDEDMRENVSVAQDMGVQVVLLTFAPTRQTGRSAALVREVDEVIVLERDFWTPHFTPTQGTQPAPTETPPDEAVLEGIAAGFVSEWAGQATQEEILQLLERAPEVPKDMYVQLLLRAEGSVGSLRPHGQAKGQLRRAFWKALRAAHRRSND
jgi:uncharacterized LabA/DUF88 family protein